MNTSYDHGKSFKLETGQILLKNHFFLDDRIVDHSYSEETILKVLGQLGGHLHFILLFLGTATQMINKNVIAAKLIRSNYYIKRPDSMKPSHHKNSLYYDIAVIKLNYFNKCFKYSRYQKDNMVDKKELF